MVSTTKGRKDKSKKNCKFPPIYKRKVESADVNVDDSTTK